METHTRSPHTLVPSSDALEAAFRFSGRVTSDLVAIVDRATRVLFVNGVSERALGAVPEACLGTPLFDFVHPDDRRACTKAFEDWLAGDGSAPLLVETRTVGCAGATCHLNWTVAPHLDRGGRVECFLVHGRDVTAQVLSDERVQESELRHRAVLSGMLDPVVTIDAFGTVVEVSRSVLEVFGYRPEELVGRNVSVLMTEPHASQHDAYLERYRRTGSTWILNTTRRFEVRRKDGTVIPCELSVSRVDVPGEAEPLFVGSFRDISARVRVEQALAESAARVRAIFDQEFEFVGLLSRDGTLLEINASALRSTGAAREEIVGRPFWETPFWDAGPGSGTDLRVRIREAIAAAAAGEFVRFEVERLNRSGQKRWTDFSLKPVRDERGEVVFLLPEGRDITPVKASHARELAIQEALAAIGESASILAHEIKNPLTAVNLALRAVADKLGEDQRVVLEDLASRLQKLESTMRRTLSFTKPLVLERAPCDLAALVREVRAALAPELARSRVELELDSPPDLPRVHADRGRLEEVLVNLVRNACQALVTGGRVRVRVEREGEANLLVLVEDDGPGIAPALREDLFKPFVTTRQGGTGLGLAIARKIVREHGGEIGVRDGALGGACFWIRLPRGDAGERESGSIESRRVNDPGERANRVTPDPG
jgi:PAS domain S-box-containing protein